MAAGYDFVLFLTSYHSFSYPPPASAERRGKDNWEEDNFDWRPRLRRNASSTVTSWTDGECAKKRAPGGARLKVPIVRAGCLFRQSQLLESPFTAQFHAVVLVDADHKDLHQITHVANIADAFDVLPGEFADMA